MSSSGVEPQDECPICIRVFGVEFARPEKCQHRFHRACLTQWSKFKLDCPMCRVTYERVFVYEQHDDKRKLIATDTFAAPSNNPLEDEDLLVGMNPYEHTHCRVCGGGENEESILMCDDCDEGFHLWCLDPPLTEVPNTDQWFCTECAHRQQGSPEEQAPVSHRGARMVRRTALAERVINTIRRVQVSSDEETSSDSEAGEHEETEVPDFEEMDRMVLDGEVLDQGVQLPSVSRRRKSKKKKVNSPKKKRSSPSALRKQTRKSRKESKKSSKKRKSEAESNGESSNKRERSDVPSLSLTGAGMAAFVDEDEGQQPESPPPVQQETDCDLLGSIIGEQEKVLTPGKLLKIEDGKFQKGDGYDEFQNRVQSKMSGKLKESLGMPNDGPRMNFWARENNRSSHTEPQNSDMDVSYEIDAEVEMQMRLHAEEEDEQLRNLQMKAKSQLKKDAFERKLLARRQREVENRERDRYRIEQQKEQRLKESRRRDRERFERQEREREEKEERRRRDRDQKDREAAEAERNNRNEESRRKEEKRSRHDEKERSHKSSFRDRERDRERDRNGRDRSDRRSRDERNGRGVTASGSAPAPPPPPLNQPMVPIAFPPPAAINPLNVQHDMLQAIILQQLMAAGQIGLPPMPAPAPAPMVLPVPPPPQGPPPVAVKPKPEDKPVKKEKRKSGDDSMKRIEEFAKKYTKKYFDAKKIDGEGYKTVMRFVVKDCVKRRVTENKSIYEKVKQAVHDLKKGKL